ncbi:craniofacial development protein 2-like protein [Lasius niger]|uniref:Craniofacial development protein 2-like protein n=1 Tax=Lasius niger TaxID=67767 RepID=A0A0J7KJH5_LASNI|nr:craniofacial development protein 2-like protein [Lasius niger]
MVIVSTCFPHKDIHKQSWMSPGYGTANQIDYIIMEAKHNSDIMDVRSYRGANVDSDHYLVIAKIRSRITTMKEEKKISQKRFETDWLECGL